MGNKLRDMLDDNSEYNKRIKARLDQVEKDGRHNGCCLYCVHVEKRYPQFSAPGVYSCYCKIDGELKSDTFGTGERCLHYKEDENGN